MQVTNSSFQNPLLHSAPVSCSVKSFSNLDMDCVDFIVTGAKFIGIALMVFSIACGIFALLSFDLLGIGVSFLGALIGQDIWRAFSYLEQSMGSNGFDPDGEKKMLEKTVFFKYII